MPGVIVEFAVDRLHDGLEGPRSQIDDQRHGAVLQRQVDVVGRLARVQDEAVALPGLEGERDLVTAALDGVLREVVAEVFRASKGGRVLLAGWKRTETDQYQPQTPLKEHQGWGFSRDRWNAGGRSSAIAIGDSLRQSPDRSDTNMGKDILMDRIQHILIALLLYKFFCL